MESKFSFTDVAKHAAKKARRRDLRKLDNDFRVAKLYKHNQNSYRIQKVREYGLIQHGLNIGFMET